MSEQQLATPITSPVDSIDPFEAYQEFIVDIPDPARELHAEFVQTMPYLHRNERLQAAQKLAIGMDGKTPDDFADNYVQDSPFVQRRVLELAYGKAELSAQEIVLQAIREGSDNGEADATEEAQVIEAIAAGDPDVTLEELYKDELDMFIQNVLGTTYSPRRELKPEPAAAYVPGYEYIEKAISRPPLVIGGTTIKKSQDVHTLMIPELIQPWEEPVQQTIAALGQGSHVLLDSRRNSGKTHIFPGVLRAQAPAGWEITEMTNNALRGGEGRFLGGSTSSDFFHAISSGISVDEAIANEKRQFPRGPSRTKEAMGEPERRILIVDEAQTTVLHEPYRAAGVLDKIVDWAKTTDTQLVLINAIGDRRAVAGAQTRIAEVIGELHNVNIEALFERPEYPRRELLTMLGHFGVGKEVARWWAGHGAARALRTMRGVYLMYDYLSDPAIYRDLQDTRLRSLQQLKQVLEHERGERVIDTLAVVCAGSGLDILTLADYFDIREPHYQRFGYPMDTVPEDIR